MTVTTDPDTLADELDLTRLLADCAGSIEPHGSSPSLLARRATRIRHRRRTAAAGIGLSASAVVATLVVTRPAPDAPSQVVADGGTTTITTAVPAPPPVGTFTAFVHQPPPQPTTPIPRLGLDSPGAVVTSGVDAPMATDVEVPPPAVSVMFGQMGGRMVYVMATFGAPVLRGTDGMPGVTTEPVDLGDGVEGTIERTPENMPGAGTTVIRTDDAGSVTVSGAGVSDEELIEVARGIDLADGDTVVVGWMPADLPAGEPEDPMVWGSGPQSALDYVLADGRSVALMVSYHPSRDIFDRDLDRILASPSEGERISEVRGHPAIVREAAGMTSVIWREPNGYLVELYVNVPGDPSAIADPGVVDSVVDLDEATFQTRLAGAHPA